MFMQGSFVRRKPSLLPSTLTLLLTPALLAVVFSLQPTPQAEAATSVSVSISASADTTAAPQPQAIMIAPNPTAGLLPGLSLTLVGNEAQAANALFLGAVAALFGVDTNVVIQMGQSAPSLETLTAFYIAQLSRAPVAVIVKERHSGKGWVAIAKAHGVPANYQGKWVSERVRKDHGKGNGKGDHKHKGDYDDDDDNDDDYYYARRFVPYTDAEFEQMIFIRFAHDYYGVEEKDVQLWFTNGLGYQDIVLMLNLSRRARVEPAALVQLRRQGLTWTVISNRYGITWTEVARPVKPSLQFTIKLEWQNK